MSYEFVFPKNPKEEGMMKAEHIVEIMQRHCPEAAIKATYKHGKPMVSVKAGKHGIAANVHVDRPAEVQAQELIKELAPWLGKVVSLPHPNQYSA